MDLQSLRDRKRETKYAVAADVHQGAALTVMTAGSASLAKPVLAQTASKVVDSYTCL